MTTSESQRMSRKEATPILKNPGRRELCQTLWGHYDFDTKTKQTLHKKKTIDQYLKNIDADSEYEKIQPKPHQKDHTLYSSYPWNVSVAQHLQISVINHNRTKIKSHMVISVDAQKTLNSFTFFHAKNSTN